MHAGYSRKINFVKPVHIQSWPIDEIKRLHNKYNEYERKINYCTC